MLSRGLCVSVAVAVLAACADAQRSRREIVLEKIPASVAAVVVANGVAISHPRVRQVVDVLRPELPGSLGCAIDAALGCDELAVGIGADRSITLVVATRAEVKCAALSQVDRGVYVATVGAGAIASGTPMIAAATFQRARPYLARAPIAFAMAFEGGELIGTAQPEPLEAWLAIDTSPELAPALESDLRRHLARMGSEPTTSPFAARLSLVREGPQVIARLARTTATESNLAAAVRTVRDWTRTPLAARPAAGAPAFPCPVPQAPITSCAEVAGELVMRTRSAKAAVALVTTSRCSPVVANQTVRGLRLEDAIPQLGLAPGDVVIGSAGRPVTSKAVLIETLGREAATGKTSLTIRRGILERTIRIDGN